jgi:hypothetical protein
MLSIAKATVEYGFCPLAIELQALFVDTKTGWDLREIYQCTDFCYVKCYVKCDVKGPSVCTDVETIYNTVHSIPCIVPVHCAQWTVYSIL